MRTTVDIDDELLEEAKAAAKREGITLTAYIERALRQCRPSGDEERAAGSQRWTFPTFPGKLPEGFPSTGSYSKMLEFLEGPDARP